MLKGVAVEIRIAVGYAFVAALWIVLLDDVLVSDGSGLAGYRVSSLHYWKDWLFVLSSTGFLYWLIHRHLAALRERKFMLTAIVDNSPTAFSLKTIDGRYVLANPNVQRIYHLGEQQVVGKTDFDLLPPDMAKVLRIHEERLLQTAAPFTAEETVMVDGCQRTHLTHFFLILDGQGSVARFIGRNSQDITQRKLDEQRLRTLSLAMEQSAESVFITDAQGSIEYVNEAFVRATGYSREEIVGKNPRMFQSGKTPSATYAAMWGALEQGFTWRGELYNRQKDGSEYVDLAIITPLRQPDGSISHYVAVQQDITERKQRDDELAHYRNQLEQVVEQRTAQLQHARDDADNANRAKSRFLAAASHDLRQPLTALALYLRVLKDRLDLDGQVLMDNIETCVESLNHLLTDLLDVSKLDAGVVVPKPVDFAVDDLIMGIISMQAAQARQRGLRLRVRLAGWITFTDRQMLLRIVSNLVENAIRYTRQGGVLIACRRKAGKHWIEIWDSGIGIPPDRIGSIFEEFRQLDVGAQSQGSGLGLAIVARMAALLDLQVRVDSKPGHGSLFAIELPLGRAIPAPLPVSSPGSHRGLRLALVEDNVEVFNALSLALLHAGHDVVGAQSGAMLLQRLGAQRVDLVITDYRLALGETGFDVIAALRERQGRKVPAILITGDTDPQVIREVVQQGVVVLHKPLQMDALLQAILNETKAESAAEMGASA